jgi:hypothetical protein
MFPPQYQMNWQNAPKPLLHRTATAQTGAAIRAD